MQDTFTPIAPGQVKLLPSVFQERFDLNRAYIMSLSSANLLQNYYLEAGLQSFRQKPEGIHWGWEAPTCQLRICMPQRAMLRQRLRPTLS